MIRHLEICSHIGQSRVRDMGHLSDIVKRRRTPWNFLTSSSPDLSDPLSHSESSRRFHIGTILKLVLQTAGTGDIPSNRCSNCCSTLVQPILSRKYEALLFLHTLASSTQTPLLAASLLPSLAPSPPITSKNTPAVSPTEATVPSQPVRKGKSKAELLRETRARSGMVTG